MTAEGHQPEVAAPQSTQRQIEALVQRFARNLDVYTRPDDKETQVRVERVPDLDKKVAGATSRADTKLYHRQIEASDAEVDALVYELHGLTEEEIAIVEGRDPISEADAGEEESTMTYRVYENWTARPDKAIVHQSDCPHANGGPIRPPTENGQWHGPFTTYPDALDAARRTGRSEVRGCKHCIPRSP